MDPVMEYLKANGAPDPVPELVPVYFPTQAAPVVVNDWLRFEARGQVLHVDRAGTYVNPTATLIALITSGLVDGDAYKVVPFVEHKPEPPVVQVLTGLGTQFQNDPYPPMYWRVSGPWPKIGTVLEAEGKRFKAVSLSGGSAGSFTVWQEL